jgi:hypothetical protein
MITLRATAILATLAVCVLAPAAQAREESCALIARGSDGETVKLMDNKTLTDAAANGAIHPIAIPASYKYPYVECTRNQITPAEADYKLLEFGLPLAIKVVGADLRVALLTVPAGHVQFAVIRGPQLTSEELADVRPRMDAIQQSLKADNTGLVN